MNRAKTKITALTLASTMLASCANNKYKSKIEYVYNNETKQEEIVGQLTKDYMHNVYIVEINDTNNDRQLYLALKQQIITAYHGQYVEFKLIGRKNVVLASNENSNHFKSDFGEYINSISINKFLLHYQDELGPLKSVYKIDEIFELYENIKQNYDRFSTNKKILSKERTKYGNQYII